MTKPILLFDRPIIAGKSLSLAEQVYEILCEEIHSGHWRIGERLPSILSLSEQSGLGSSPIRVAFDRLKEEGYVRQEKRTGTFLASLTPENNKPLGVIGIAMVLYRGADAWQSAEHSPFRLHKLLEAAEKRSYLTEVKYLEKEDDWEALDSKEGPFSDRVQGIISLYPFPRLMYHKIAPGRTPLVFMGVNSLNSLPAVAGDSRSGFHLITQSAIEMGHKNIVLFCDSGESAHERQNRQEGFELAMQSAGVPISSAAIERSMAISGADLNAMRRFLEEFSDATAIVCMKREDAINLISVADMIGLDVPGELSVVCQDLGPMRPHRPEKWLTCIRYQTEEIIDNCFDILFEQMRTGRSSRARITTSPFIGQGASLAPPRENAKKQIQGGVKCSSTNQTKDRPLR